MAAVSDTRERIAAQVERAPGVHFRELVRRLDLGQGQAQYHLRRLRRGERLIAEEVDGRTHYFSPTYDAAERRALAVLRRETARDVLATLLVEGPSPPAAVADDLDVARSTLEWHLDRLTGSKLVAKRRDDRNRVTLTVPDRERATRLLAEIDPTLPERLVDRFTRLVDGLLYE